MREVARVAAGRLDRARLLGIAARERDLVPAVRRGRARTRFPTSPRRRRRLPPTLYHLSTPLTSADEVDRHRHSGELEPLAQLVLDPVGVVAGDEARVVDVDPDARRARRDLGAVEQVQAPAALRRRLAGLAQLGERVVQRRRRDPAGVLLEERDDVVEQAVEAAAGLRRDRDHRRALAQPRLEPRLHVLERDLVHVPLREHDERRAARLARDVRDGEILLDDALARVDQDERDVGALGGLERAQLRVVLDPLPLLALAPQARRVDEQERAARRARGSCRSRRASCRGRPRRSPARARRARSGATTCRRSAGRGSRRGSSPRPTGAPPLARELRDDLVEQVAGAVAVQRGERPRIAEPEPVELGRLEVLARVVDLVREHEAPASSSARSVTASSSSPGVIPCRASTTKRTRSASSDRRPRLLRDLGAEDVGGEVVDAAGVDQEEVDAVPLADELLAVARHPRRLVDDRLAASP